jgi:hypothetical protein
MRKKITASLVLVAVLSFGSYSAGTHFGNHLPKGFTIQQNDGVTYVCSTSPVMCTGNEPSWAK